MILAGSLRQDQDVCVPREQLSVQDSNADGSKDKFPWLRTGSGGSAITWDSLLCLGVKLITALTLPSSNRDVSQSLFLPFADAVDHPTEGGALGAHGVLAVPLGLCAGDDLLARRP